MQNESSSFDIFEYVDLETATIIRSEAFRDGGSAFVRFESSKGIFTIHCTSPLAVTENKSYITILKTKDDIKTI